MLFKLLTNRRRDTLSSFAFSPHSRRAFGTCRAALASYVVGLGGRTCGRDHAAPYPSVAVWDSSERFALTAYRALEPIDLHVKETAEEVHLLSEARATQRSDKAEAAMFLKAKAMADDYISAARVRHASQPPFRQRPQTASERHYALLDERDGVVVVATCHPESTDADRLRIRDAAEAAGFAVARIVSEPVAAAIAYDKVCQRREQLPFDHHLLVVDVSCDQITASLLLTESGVYEVVACASSEAAPAACGNRSKEDANAVGHTVTAVCQRCVAEGEAAARAGGGAEPLTVSDVILTGGELQTDTAKLTSAVDAIQRLVNLTPRCAIDPSQCVALGAAVSGSYLCRYVRPLCLSALFFSVGVATAGGLFTPLIARNTLSPTPTKTITLTLSKVDTPSQSSCVTVPFDFYFGDRVMAADNVYLGRVGLTIPLLPQAEGDRDASVDLTARVDGDVLHVTAAHKASGVSASSAFQLHFGSLGFDAMVDAVEINAQADADRRSAVIESLNARGIALNSVTADVTAPV